MSEPTALHWRVMTMSIVGASRVLWGNLSQKSSTLRLKKEKRSEYEKRWTREKYFAMKFHSNKTRFTTLSMPLPHCAVTSRRLHSLFLILLIDQLFQDENRRKSWNSVIHCFYLFFSSREQSLSLWKNNNSRSESERKTYINNLISQFFSSSRLALTHAKMLHEHFFTTGCHSRQVAVIKECEN